MKEWCMKDTYPCLIDTPPKKIFIVGKSDAEVL
jgi:hypothetical protein